jgi:hypothetical protein
MKTGQDQAFDEDLPSLSPRGRSECRSNCQLANPIRTARDEKGWQR